MKTLLLILLFIWQLPLNILGLLYRDYLTYKDKCQIINSTKDYEIYVKDSSGSVTLGRYIFVSSRFTSDTIKHEIGHTIQSKYLGILYLIIIGIPSILWAIIYSKTSLKGKYNYYTFYTESWANKLVN